MTAQEYLSNASIYECQAIEMLQSQGKALLLCKVLHRGGDITWIVFTREEAQKHIANYPSDPKYHSTTGYYNIVETIAMD